MDCKKFAKNPPYCICMSCYYHDICYLQPNTEEGKKPCEKDDSKRR